MDWKLFLYTYRYIHVHINLLTITLHSQGNVEPSTLVAHNGVCIEQTLYNDIKGFVLHDRSTMVPLEKPHDEL